MVRHWCLCAAVWRVIGRSVCVCVCVAIWRVIRSWLTTQQRNRTLLVNRSQLVEYIDADQLEPHMTDTVNTAAPAADAGQQSL